MTGTANNRDQWLGLLVSTFVLLPSFVWVYSDSRIWPWDQAWYGEVANDLWFLLKTDPTGWLVGMMKLMPQKPPLVSWLGQFLVPLGLGLGKMEFALLLLNIAANIGTLFLLWAYARRISPNSIALALLAVVAGGSMPLFVGMGHQFVTEPLQTLIITGSFVLAAMADRVRLPRLTIQLFLLVSAGFAVKTTSPAYNGFALALIGWIVLTKWKHGERMFALNRGDQVLMVFTFVVTALTIGWYWTNFNGMLQHVRNALSTDIASHYGSVAALPVKATYWLLAFDNGSSLVAYMGLVAFGAASFSVLLSSSEIIRAKDLASISALLALVHSAIILIQFMFQVMEETRFITSLMPMMIIVLVYSLSRARALRLIKPFFGLSIAQLVAVHLIAADRVSFVSPTVWLKPTVLNSDQRLLADAIIEATCPVEKPYQYVVVGVEDTTMNANSLAFHAAQARNISGYRCYYTGLGYAAIDLQKAWDRVESLNPVSILVPNAEGLQSNPDYLNKLVTPFSKRMTSNNHYRHIKETISGFSIYRRNE